MKKQVFDKQAIFTRVLTFLRKQKVQSMEGNDCAYRGANGKMCAIGCIIPDEVMAKHMSLNNDSVDDNEVIDMLTGDVFTKKSFAPTQKKLDENLIFLRNIQSAHDHDLSNGMRAFNKQMKFLADRYGLEYTKVKK